MKTLVIGYGNIDRQDDGVAWHFLRALAERLGYRLPEYPEENPVLSTPALDMHFYLQLMPEMAEWMADFSRIVFVDAHTGSVPDEIHLEEVQPVFQSSPLTHHLTPAACLSLVHALYGQQPQAVLLSLRGYAFGFERALSPQTESLLTKALQVLETWLHQTAEDHSLSKP